MARPSKKRNAASTPLFRTLNLSKHFNWPRRVPRDEWWQQLAERVRERYPTGTERAWGIPFAARASAGLRAVLVAKGGPAVTVPVGKAATFLCFLHSWEQLPASVRWEMPSEGLVAAEYELTYEDGTTHTQPVRARFEVGMKESPGPPWLAVSPNMPATVDPARPTGDMHWGGAQPGLGGGPWDWRSGLLVYAMPNPFPHKRIRAVTLRGHQESPLLVAALTLFNGADSPVRHFPRRTYRVNTTRGPAKIKHAEVDLGGVARMMHTAGPRDRAWLRSPYRGISVPWGSEAVEPERDGEDLIEAFGAQDATVSVSLAGGRKPLEFSLGEAFTKGKSAQGAAALEVLGRRRQWMKITVVDSSTGKPTPARVHFSGPRGDYIAPYGHHSQINPNWFEDYGADVLIAGRSFAYVSGEFTTDMPVGDVYVEICKGFEYQPVRAKVSIKPGQKELALTVSRWKDLRSEGWVTADTHVHFISPQTAWLQAQGEGVNVVNLLASQWGRLFTNVGDYSGRVGVVENDTIVYVGTENRNHMLGHMSMLGTKGPLPVFPMCAGGPSESWVGDPDFVTMAEWALENRRKGGVVIRPHFPGCGHTEDPVSILRGLVDALEIGQPRDGFPLQEWYRYLNCGYRVAVCGGTDKMSAGSPLGWQRTYARLDSDRPLTYDAWAEAVRAGRTVSTTGPVIDLCVEGRGIGDTIELPASGGTLEARATAECFAPLGMLELVHNGKVVAAAGAARGAKRLELSERIKVNGTSWIAARCVGAKGPPVEYLAAHTSPVYVNCPGSRLFDGPAARHMLALVEGGIEYLNTLATLFDEASRKRMVKVFNEAREELRGRLVVEAKHAPHYGGNRYHTHGPEDQADHSHD